MGNPINDSLIQNAVALGMGSNQPAANLAYGAQLGVGIKEASLDASTPLVFTPTVFVVLHTPTMYAGVDGNIVGKTIKTLIETHAKSVSGVDLQYTLETGESPVGHDGQNMAVPTQTKRQAVNPSFTFTEVTGNLVWKLMVQWITDIKDPDTYASMGRIETEGLQFMSSTYSMSMIGIQFDPSMQPKSIIDAAFYSNMFPTDPGGALGLERQIATSKTMDRTVVFTGHIQHNKKTRELGVEIASIMQAAKARYGGNRAPYYNTVESAIDNNGLRAEVEKLL